MSRQAELKKLNVVAGILVESDERVLIAERLGDGPFHGMWEFPGGKIRQGEAAAAALRRELSEEIGVDAHAGHSLMRLDHRYPDRHVAIEFFIVSEWRNDPRGLEGQALKWVHIAELDAQDLLPADAPVVDELKQRFL